MVFNNIYIYIINIYRGDGSKYIGKWINGKRHGTGTYYSVKGEKKIVQENELIDYLD